MTHTFWHAGNLIGESDLAFTAPDQRLHAGILHPTPYGLTVLPGLTRMLSTMSTIKRRLDARGRDFDSLNEGQIDEVMRAYDIERDLRSMGRLLVDIVVKRPDGASAAAVMFSDVQELRRAGADVENVTEQLSVVPQGVNYYVVSVVFESMRSVATRAMVM